MSEVAQSDARTKTLSFLHGEAGCSSHKEFATVTVGQSSYGECWLWPVQLDDVRARPR